MKKNKKEHIAIKALLLTIAFFLFFLISVYIASAGIEGAVATQTTTFGLTGTPLLWSTAYTYNGSYFILAYQAFGANHHLRLCALNTSYAVSTLGACQDKDLGSNQVGFVWNAVHISSDGLTLIALNSTSVSRYSLSTPYNITSLTYMYSYGFSANQYHGMAINYQGITGNEGVAILSFILSSSKNL